MEIKEIKNKEWDYRGKTIHIVNCHFQVYEMNFINILSDCNLYVQEIPENGADLAHLEGIHSDPLIFGNDLRTFERFSSIRNYIRHRWISNWKSLDPPDGHIAHMELTHQTLLMGKNIFQLDLDIKQIGPAIVNLSVKTSFLGGMSGVYIQSVIPLEVKKQMIIHHVYSRPTLKNRLFSKFLLYGEAIMVIPILA